MKKNIIAFCASVMLIGMLTGCLKSVDKFQSNTITVKFNSSGPKFVTQDVTVNPGDSIQFNFTIDSPSDMRYIYLQKNGTSVTTDTIKTGSLTTFSAIKKLVADVTPGGYIYAVVAKDAAGKYLGSSSFVVTVKTDFDYYTARTLYVPDTTAKTNPCYFSTTTGQVFSFSGVGSNSGLIDFGYYYDTDVVPVVVSGVTTLVPNSHTVYALNITPIPTQVGIYDISSFTKNATKFAIPTVKVGVPVGTAATPIVPTMASLTSSAGLQVAGAANFGTPLTKVNHLSPTANTSTTTPGTAFFMFKTAAGKYGAVQIMYTNGSSAAKGTYMNIEVKVQR